jgi:hypothetical protein
MSYHNIPAELQVLNQWVCWRLELTDTGKETKVPYDAKTGRMASHADPTTWSSFEQAVAVVGNYSGIGFVFSYADPYCGIDLDVKPETDADTFARQKKIFKAMDSYSELSPSGLGLHIIVKAKVEHGRKREAVEVYSNLRYFTFTGNIFDGKSVINERQELIDILWTQMGAASQNESIYAGKPTQSVEDDDLFTQICSAQNGDKFLRLWQGDKSDYDGDWSRADQALMNFLAYHSGHIPQMVRMFRSSILGDREKAMRDKYMEYTYKRAFDLTLPPIDLSAIINSMNSAATVLPPPETGSQPGTALVSADRDAVSGPNIIDGFDLDIWRRIDPPYAMKLIMDFTLDRAPYPVREMGICASLALMAGLCGRAYNVSNTGLNLYIMLVAATGRGKESMSAAIEQIFSAVANEAEFPSIMNFAGPRTAASGAGLERYLSEMPVPCCLTITGEIGIKLKRMSSENASPAEEQLKGSVLELFVKSHHGAVYRPQVHADKKNNIEGILAPAWSWLGEGVPSTFYESLTEAHVVQGLIPRFLIVDYLGDRVDYNEQHSLARVSPELRSVIKSVAENSMQLNQQNKVIDVPFTKEAMDVANQIRLYVDKTKINKIKDEIILGLWNRHHLKVLKIAALLAISTHNIQPLVTPDMVLWANSLCMTDVFNLMGKFERGEIGNDEAPTHDDKQMEIIKKYFKRYITGDLPTISATMQMYRDKGCITKSVLSNAVKNYKPFAQDNQGQMKAIEKCLQEYEKFGYLQRVNNMQTDKWFGSLALTYVFTKEGINVFLQ